MSRSSKVAALGPLQWEVMRVLWASGEATVGEVVEALARGRRPALTTVATTLARMEKRGLVAHRAEGRLFVYRAAIAEGQVRRRMVSDLLARLFQGDAAALVSHLLSEREVREDTLERLDTLLRDARSKAGDRGGKAS
jgi:predicted transcriptional regulator